MDKFNIEEFTEDLVSVGCQIIYSSNELYNKISNLDDKGWIHLSNLLQQRGFDIKYNHINDCYVIG